MIYIYIYIIYCILLFVVGFQVHFNAKLYIGLYKFISSANYFLNKSGQFFR